MKFCQLIFISKNKRSIANLINTCIKNKLGTVLQFVKKKNRKKIFTILKSPHVNKIAQEQFEERLVLNCINVKSHKINKLLVLLKKTFINYYPDVKILINFNVYRNQAKFVTKVLNFLKLNFRHKVINYKLYLNKIFRTKMFHKIERFNLLMNAKNNLKQLESYGELQTK